MRRAISLAVCVVLMLALGTTTARAAVTQPAQPKTGPESSRDTHGGVRVSAGGTGPSAWYVFEPTAPQPASAPVAVVTHGYYEFSGNAANAAIARHTARMGNVVIYTRWQTGVVVPCLGPINIEPCMASEVAGIKGALADLRADKTRVQPQLDRVSYFGFSFGAIITANLANRWKAFGVPRPRAVWLDDPEDGGVAGPGEPALDRSLAGIPSTTKFVCHSGAEGALVLNAGGVDTSSCNAVFPRLGQIPAANKSLVLTSPDDHGTPALSSQHGVCAGALGNFKVDAYDWGFCWRSWDALRSCAYTGQECEYALGNTPQNRFIGTWSDGTPIVGLKVQTSGLTAPQPTPARAPAPPKRNLIDRPATAKVTAVVRRSGRVTAVRGTAADDRGVASVELAVVRRKGSTCSQLTPAGAFAALKVCSRPSVLLTAKGTRAWTVTLPKHLEPGGYTLVVRATDSAGQQRQSSPRAVDSR